MVTGVLIGAYYGVRYPRFVMNGILSVNENPTEAHTGLLLNHIIRDPTIDIPTLSLEFPAMLSSLWIVKALQYQYS